MGRVGSGLQCLIMDPATSCLFLLPPDFLEDEHGVCISMCMMCCLYSCSVCFSPPLSFSLLCCVCLSCASKEGQHSRLQPQMPLLCLPPNHNDLIFFPLTYPPPLANGLPSLHSADLSSASSNSSSLGIQ